MASTSSLSSHDISILSKIADPESSPSSPLLLDPSLPKDPYHDPSTYLKISTSEKQIISEIQSIELQIAGLRPLIPNTASLLEQYHSAIKKLDELSSEYPKYASVRNNRVQALRRVYGDGVLIKASQSTILKNEAQPLEKSTTESTLIKISTTILTDLSTAIALLTPPPFSPLSHVSAKTLSSLYTQRGALYHYTAKQLSGNPSSTNLLLSEEMKEASWTASDFEEAAARDFMMGGRYGNEVAKALAVSVNPTAKLCGEMVRDAMRREFGGGQDV
jgi:hypothetical protein